MLLFEFKVQIAEYLATVKGTELRTLADLIQFNLDHCPEEMKYFGQEIFELAEATSGDLDDPEYRCARDLNHGFSRDVIDGVLAQGYDAIVTPTYSFGTTTAATAGYASMAVPVGFTDGGRPVGFWLAAGLPRRTAPDRRRLGDRVVLRRTSPTAAPRRGAAGAARCRDLRGAGQPDAGGSRRRPQAAHHWRLGGHGR